MELKLEGFEAIRLSDHLGLDQREAAKFMGISQQTYSRVLKEARKCVAGALINGNIIRVKGGEYEFDPGKAKRSGRSKNPQLDTDRK